MCASAKAAAIVHEFHNRDIALRVSTDERVAVIEQCISIRARQFNIVQDLLLLLALLKDANGVADDLWVFQDIRPDFRLKSSAFRISHRVKFKRVHTGPECKAKR